MKLTELDPAWVGAGGTGVSMPGPDACPHCAGLGCATCYQTGKQYVPAPARHGVGLSFLCPCASCTARRTGNPDDDDFYLRVFVGLRNPLDGGPPHDPREAAQWTRVGDTFATLTLTPSIQRHKIGDHGCTWHGFITNGEVSEAR